MILPSALTAVASIVNMPAPDSSICPQWIRCQSVAPPSSAEYWHIGDTTMRLGSATPRSAMGSNRCMEVLPAAGEVLPIERRRARAHDGWIWFRRWATRAPPQASGDSVDQIPAAAFSASALSVASQVNSGSSRPKWPYAAVFE